MRAVEPTATGMYRVRFRHAGQQTSKTFKHQRDARTFALHLDNGGPAAALTWLAGRQQNVDQGYTFAEWFAHYVDHLTGVTERTRADYRAQHRRYLTELDNVPLALLTKAHVSVLVNGMERAGRSPKTIKNAVNLLSSCLASAVEEGHMTRNPAKGHRLPKGGVRDESALFLMPDQFARLMENIPPHYRPLVLTLAGSGLRWSEATALYWRHVNFIACTIRVEQAWKRVPGKGFELGRPKSDKSIRTVNPGSQVFEVLAPLRGAASEFVFTTPTGRPVSHANFHARVWKPATAAAGLSVGPHALRHTHASWLIEMGAPLEAIQAQLGHEQITTTRGTYGHLMPAMGARVAQAAADALRIAGQVTPGPAAAELEA